MSDSKRDDELDLPEGLRRALVDLHTPQSNVPSHVDHAVLGRARRDYRGRRRMWIGTRWAAIALAAAAMVTVAVRLLTPVVEGNKPQVARVGDVNHDNQVDILDAYIVARHIARHEPMDKAWDVNGDGVVDQKDVDQIAATAVAAPDSEQAR
jgi:anti-sigma-K factor RskA